MKVKQIPIPSFIDDIHDLNHCTKCNYEFKIGESILIHYVENHLEFVLKLISAGEKALNLEHDHTPDEYYLERQKNKGKGFVPPKCKKCNHDEPDYTVISNPPHKNGIKLKCIHCGNISIKD